MPDNNSFTIGDLINHVTNQVIMADTDMQLNQGYAWQKLTQDFPLAAGSSHLKFLGLDEIELSFNLSQKKPNFFKRSLVWIRLLKPDKSKTFRIVPANQSQYLFKIVVKRGANNQFRAKTNVSIPDAVSVKDKLVN